MARTASLWYTWVNKTGEDLGDLPEEIVDLYRRSLLDRADAMRRRRRRSSRRTTPTSSGATTITTRTSGRATARSSRDAMDRAGFPEIARRFLSFAHEIISNDGYFLHKYTPDGSLASLVASVGARRQAAAADSGGRDGARRLAAGAALRADARSRVHALACISASSCSRRISWSRSAIR